MILKDKKNKTREQAAIDAEYIGRPCSQRSDKEAAHNYKNA
jgi:hypothetical protein